MAIVINGSGTITGVSVGGLPDGSVDSDTLATGIDATKVVSFALLSATIDVSTTGNQDVTGSLGGATPIGAWMFSSDSSTVGTFSGWGFYDGTAEENFYSRDHISAGTYGPNNGKFYTSAVSAGAIQQADASFITNGVRLNKSMAVGSPTGSIDIQIMVIY